MLELGSVAQGIVADLRTVGLDHHFGLFDLRSQTWLRRPDSIAPGPPRGFGSTGQVAMLRGSQALVADDEDALSPQSVLELVGFVQDCAMDELGFGWPEYGPGGRYLGVLAPTAVADVVWWSLHGDPVQPLGSLPSLPSGSIKTEA